MKNLYTGWNLRAFRALRRKAARLGQVLAIALLAVTSTGCTSVCKKYINCRDYVNNHFKVGPEYCKPSAAVANAWIDEYDARVRLDTPNYADWWTVFNDPILDGLMEDLYRQNLTLKVAGLRVQEARQLRAIAVGTWFPQFQQLTGEASKTQIVDTTRPIPRNFIPNLADLDVYPRNHALGFDAAWELDFWGKFRRNIESADASLDASVENYDAVLVSLLGEAASTYIELRTAQEQLRFANANVEIQKGSLDIAKVQFEAGGVTELDVTQATNNLRNTAQLIPLIETQVRLANNRLCVLLGLPTQDLESRIGVGPVPTAPADVAVGIPCDLLRRRPDVRAAERRVAVQSARIGVASADLLPHFSIRGSISTQAENANSLFSDGSWFGRIAPGFNWDILNYGRLLNNVLVQDTRFQQLAVQYQQTVLEANAEVESAIVAFLRAQDRLREVSGAVEASKRSVELALTQYQDGATDFDRVFNLQARLVNDQNTLASVQGDIARSLVAINKALGGGWEIRYGIRRGPGPMMVEGMIDELPAPQEADDTLPMPPAKES